MKINNFKELQNRILNLSVRPPLQNFDLTGANLSGADLSNIDLSGPILYDYEDEEEEEELGVNLESVILIGANLQGANLQGARLFKAQLQGAQLQRANLSKSILQEANLERANLQEANLQGADLRRVKLFNTNLNKVNLHKTYLSGINFIGSSLREADLSEANLSGAILRNIDLRGADLTNADLTGAYLTGTNLTDTMLDLTRYGLPQDLFPTETLVSLTNPENLSFLLCLHNKIRNLARNDPGPGDGLPSIHQGLNKFIFTKGAKLATKVLYSSRFGRHIFDFFKLTQAQFNEVKRRMIDSLPLLYSLNYENLKGEEFCAEIVEKRMKDLVKQLLNSGKGKAKTKRRRKLSFRKKASK